MAVPHRARPEIIPRVLGVAANAISLSSQRCGKIGGRGHVRPPGCDLDSRALERKLRPVSGYCIDLLLVLVDHNVLSRPSMFPR